MNNLSIKYGIGPKEEFTFGEEFEKNKFPDVFELDTNFQEYDFKEFIKALEDLKDNDQLI